MPTEPVRVFIPDPSYGGGSSLDLSDEEASLQFGRLLEEEYGSAFQPTSIGTGAALAALFTELFSDPAAVALALFFAGKPIKDGLEAWGSIYQRLTKFFHHNPTFDREGAAILGYEAIVERLGGVPNSYQLTGFAIQNRLAEINPMKLPDPGELRTIEPAPDRVQAAAVYVFQVVADGMPFRFRVVGRDVEFLEPVGRKE